MFQDKQIKIVVFISTIILVVLISFIVSNLINIEKIKPDNTSGPTLSMTTDSNIFKLDTITIYSSANALNNDNMQKDYWDLNLYQYSDISIKIDNNVSINNTTQKNTVKQIYIDNISYPKTPDKGNPRLYIKESSLFGKGIIDPEYLIDGRYDFDVVSSNSDENSSTSFYADCSNPILLSSINEDIVPKFIIRNTNSAITFDGNLLLDATILLSNIEYSVSFSIHIINELDEEYVSTITLPIKLSDENDTNTIYDGSYQVQATNITEYKFYKVEEN